MYYRDISGRLVSCYEQNNYKTKGDNRKYIQSKRHGSYYEKLAKEYFKTREDKMKEFKKEDLTTRHVVKLRECGNCAILEQLNHCGRIDMVTYNREFFGDYVGLSNLEDYGDDLKIKSKFAQYDIMAIKKYKSASEAIGAVINEEEIDWDWERKELTEITTLDQLEGVRKELREKYGIVFKFFISNEDGNYNIICKNKLIGETTREHTLDSEFIVDLEEEGYILNLT